MLRDADVADLVEVTYAAGTDSTGWPIFLQRILRALDANVAGILVQDMRTQSGAFSFNHGLSPDWQRAYQEYYAARNVWMRGARELNVSGNVRTSEERCPTSELVKTEFYSDFLRPVGIFHGCGGTILREGELTANITVLRRKPAFGDEARRLLRVLVPHLRRALITYRRLAGAQLQEHTVLAALDRLPTGVLLIDREGGPIFVNVEAGRIIAERDGVWLNRGALTTARPADTRLLRGLVARAATPGGGGGSMALGRPSRRALGVDVVPLVLPLERGLSPRVVAVFVVDPDRRRERDERLLARLYQLTPAEAALAGRLATGDSLKEAAAHRQIGLETARTHVKRILRKTGTRRQAELVLRLQQGPMRVAAPPPA